MKNLLHLQRFWISFILILPMLFEMFLMPFNFHIPGYKWIAFITTTIIMLLVAVPYWKSAWYSFKVHQANMNTLVSIGTSVAYFYSLFALMTNRAVYFESAAFIALFVLLGDIIEEHMHQKASNTLKKLMALQVKNAEVLKNGKFVKVPLSKIKTGDIIQVRPGEKIPVDGIITQGATSINESTITGESMPVSKNIGDQVIGTTINLNGVIQFKTTKIGKDTMMSQIIEMVKTAQTSHAPIQNLTDKISKFFVPAVLIISLITFTAWYVFLNASFIDAILFAIAVVVIACPCALGLATPTALMVGTAKAAKMGILIKDGKALEQANNIKIVAFDKTGTITKGSPIVTDIIGNKNEVLKIAASLEEKSEHPLALAIINKVKAEQIQYESAQNFKNIQGKGITAEINHQLAFIGSPKLAQNYSFSDELKQKALVLQNEAKTVVFVGINKQVIGLIAIQDVPKKTSAAAISKMKMHGIEPIMITGDNEQVAHAIAKQVGIEKVIANVLPAEKANYIRQLQKSHGHTVAFVGDGINDAPALTTADIGIVMRSGTDIAIDSSEIVLMENDLNEVVYALTIAHKTFNRIKLNLFWALIYNIIGIPIASGLFINWGLSLSPELAGLAMAFSSATVVGSSLLLNQVKIK